MSSARGVKSGSRTGSSGPRADVTRGKDGKPSLTVTAPPRYWAVASGPEEWKQQIDWNRFELNRMMDVQGRDVVNSALETIVGTGYFIKCTQCAALLPKMMGMPYKGRDVPIWKGWERDGQPPKEAFLEAPPLSDGCPICKIEAHSRRRPEP